MCNIRKFIVWSFHKNTRSQAIAKNGNVKCSLFPWAGNAFCLKEFLILQVRCLCSGHLTAHKYRAWTQTNLSELWKLDQNDGDSIGVEWWHVINSTHISPCIEWAHAKWTWSSERELWKPRRGESHCMECMET